MYNYKEYKYKKYKDKPVILGTWARVVSETGPDVIMYDER